MTSSDFQVPDGDIIDLQRRRWACYLSQKRREAGLSRRQLAHLADMDPSFIHGIETYGHQPARPRVIRLARALRRPRHEVLLMAGYAPRELTPDVYEQLLTRPREVPRWADELIREMAHLTPRQQRRAVRLIQDQLRRVIKPDLREALDDLEGRRTAPAPEASER